MAINRNILWGLSTVCLLGISGVKAAEIEMNTAQMQAMDKITGRVNVIEVPVGGEVKFGSFSVVVRSCKTRSEDEIPENFAFVDVTDKSFDKEEFNIFKGWMFSSSPAINAIEHPIYDVWLLKCINTEVKPEQLLSEEALAARDNLPRLEEVKKEQEQLQENSFSKTEDTIEFKDSMYKEEKAEQIKTDKIIKEDEEGPENLLNIKDSYEEPEEQEVTLPAEELSKALNAESEKLAVKNEEENSQQIAEPDVEVQEGNFSPTERQTPQDLPQWKQTLDNTETFPADEADFTIDEELAEAIDAELSQQE